MSDLPPPLPPSMPPWPPSDGGFQPPQPFVYPSVPPKTRADLPASGRGSVPSALRRLFALVIDLFLLNIALSEVLIAPYVTVKKNKTSVALPVKAEVALWGAYVLYEAVCIAFRGQTVGGWILKVRVVRYIDGGPVMPYQAFIRALIPWLPLFVASALPSGFSWIGIAQLIVFFSIFFQPLLRGYHDKAAGTIVLRSR